MGPKRSYFDCFSIPLQKVVFTSPARLEGKRLLLRLYFHRHRFSLSHRASTDILLANLAIIHGKNTVELFHTKDDKTHRPSSSLTLSLTPPPEGMGVAREK